MKKLNPTFRHPSTDFDKGWKRAKFELDFWPQSPSGRNGATCWRTV